MASLMLYRVLREHHGDKPYVTGDERVADPTTVSHLVGRVLETIGPVSGDERGEKSEGKPPSNKATTAAPARRAAKAKSRKGK